MAGTFGFISKAGYKGSGILEKMSQALASRGTESDTLSAPPFHGGIVKYPSDIATSVVSTAESHIVAVCEGEIYNLLELCGLLGKDASNLDYFCSFGVVPNLYLKYGKDFAGKINGVFTIALWDQRDRTLMLVRDHLGSHSVFFVQAPEAFLFSSSIDALFSTGLVSKDIDPVSIDRYLASLSLSAPHTMFKEVHAVRPGHAVIVDEHGITEHAYWPFHEITENYQVSEQDLISKIKDLFQDAVKIRAECGGNIGVLVSGGVDTSAVAAVLAKTQPQRELAGFSIAFDEKAFSDAPLQEIIYSRFNLKPNLIVLSPDVFADALASGVRSLDSPVNDVALAGMLHAFSSAAKAGCTAVFEGEGSDEIFCTSHSLGELGVQRFLFMPYALRHLMFGWLMPFFSEKKSFLSKGIRFLARIGMSDFERRSTWIPGFPWKTRKKLLGMSFPPEQTWDVSQRYYSQTRLNDAINIYQYGLTRLFLPDDLLFKNERMASAAGVVNRTPFIDYRLVEKAFEVPARYKLRNPTNRDDGTKLIFKKAMRGLVPDEILDRKKTRGFSQPTAVWYRRELKEFVHDNLFARNARIYDWLDRNTVTQIYSDFMHGYASSDYFINSLLILELWMQNHL